MYSESQINLDKVDEHRHPVQLIFIFFSKGLEEKLITFILNYSILSNYFWAFKKQDVYKNDCNSLTVTAIFKSLYLKMIICILITSWFTVHCDGVQIPNYKHWCLCSTNYGPNYCYASMDSSKLWPNSSITCLKLQNSYYWF